jgi:hypothetical protein
MTAQTKPTSRHRFLMDEAGNKTELELAINALCTWWIRVNKRCAQKLLGKPILQKLLHFKPELLGTRVWL